MVDTHEGDRDVSGVGERVNASSGDPETGAGENQRLADLLVDEAWQQQVIDLVGEIVRYGIRVTIGEHEKFLIRDILAVQQYTKDNLVTLVGSRNDGHSIIKRALEALKGMGFEITVDGNLQRLPADTAQKSESTRNQLLSQLMRKTFRI